MQYQAATDHDQKTCNDILARFDRYIINQVRRLSYPAVVHTSVLDLEIDEFIQCVRIKFWHALEKREIRYPAVYIRCIIRSELVNITRRRKQFVPFPADDEYPPDEAGTFVDRCLLDPAEEVEQREGASDRLKEAIQGVLALPPRQRLAMICALRDRVDDLAQLIEAFKAYHVDIEAIQWPVSKAEKQLLQASLTQARKTLKKSASLHGKCFL